MYDNYSKFLTQKNQLCPQISPIGIFSTSIKAHKTHNLHHLYPLPAINNNNNNNNNDNNHNKKKKRKWKKKKSSSSSKVSDGSGKKGRRDGRLLLLGFGPGGMCLGSITQFYLGMSL